MTAKRLIDELCKLTTEQLDFQVETEDVVIEYIFVRNEKCLHSEGDKAGLDGFKKNTILLG